jgi:hypothetical protein
MRPRQTIAQRMEQLTNSIQDADRRLSQALVQLDQAPTPNTRALAERNVDYWRGMKDGLKNAQAIMSTN